MKDQTQQKFSAFSILIVFLVCCLIGIALIPRLTVQLFPSSSTPSVTISSSMGNASQEVTEMELTNPLENVLSGMKGIRSLSSTTTAGRATIQVELDKWTDPELFRFEASALLRQLHGKLPENASYPMVSLGRSSGGRTASGQNLLGYTLNGPGGANALAELAEEQIRPVLAKVVGIGDVSIAGTKSERIVILTNAAKMQEAGIRHEEVVSALQVGMGKLGLGIIPIHEQRVEMAIESNLTDVDQLSSYPIKSIGSRIIRLQDIARIEQAAQPEQSYYRINGQDLISISLSAQEEVNIVNLAQEARQVMEVFQHELPEGYVLTLNYDSSEFIKEELGKIYLRTFLSLGILLAFVMLIVRQVRYLLIVIASIGVNVLVSLIFYYFFKLEIHLYSLAGITISIGLIIDNVIVIVEDIRHTGRNRIFAAILASTFTALGALSVIFLLEESQRMNLLDFAIAIIINLLVSLPVAYYFIPALLEKFPVVVKKNPVLIRRKRRLVKFSRLYYSQICFMLGRKWIFISLLILAFGLPVYMLPQKIELIEPNRFEGNRSNSNQTEPSRTKILWAKSYNAVFGSDFYNKHLREPINKYLGGATHLYMRSKGGGMGQRSPEDEDRAKLMVNISMPNGATLPQMDAVVKDFESYLTQFEAEIDVFTASVSGPNSGTINISFHKDYEGSFPHRLKALLESQAIMAGSADFSVYGVGRGFSNAINLESYDSSISLKGYNYEQLQILALRVMDTLKQNPRVADMMISSQDRYSSGRSTLYEYQVKFTQPEYLALYQIARWNMSNSMRPMEEQQSSLGMLNKGDKLQTLAVLSQYENPPKVWSALQMPLPINDSTMLRLADLSEISRVKTGSAIIRRNKEYLLNVHYRFIGNFQLNDMVQKRVIANINKDLPFGYEAYAPGYGQWGGMGGAESYKDLWYIGLVLLIIYMICAVLLESFKQPFAVILMIPFSFIGVFLLFYFLGLKFDQGGYAALLMLSGLVTNVALYIINDINFIKKRFPAASVEDKIKIYIKAFNAKAMPIMITTASAILSLLPFMINGEEKGFWFTLSAGTIGGLLFSVLGAYLMLPLALLGRLKKKNRKRIRFRKLNKE